MREYQVSNAVPEFSYLILNRFISVVGHKVILAARSEYFRAMLFGSLSESTKREIELSQVPKEAFKTIMKYIYTGRISLRQITPSSSSQQQKQINLILDILGLSNLFGYDELKIEISNYLKNSLRLENVCNILDASRLYELTALINICYTYIDKNADKVLKHESFKILSKDSLTTILSRDSFSVPEIEIFIAIKEWIDQNRDDVSDDDIKEIVSKVRLPLISLDNLLTIVRPTAILDANYLLDAIHVKTQSRVHRLHHRGSLCPDINVFNHRNGGKIIAGECEGYTVPDETQRYTYDMEKGYIKHTITASTDDCITVDLNNIFIINHFKMLLWDLDNRSYSYAIDVCVEMEHGWDQIIDYSKYLCRSWQFLYFPQRPVRYIRIRGTHNTVNRVFHLVTIEAIFTSSPPTVVDGLVVPKINVATVEKSATVLEGVSRNKNSLLNGVGDYDWDFGYTCHQLGSGNILIQLGQPYLISSIRILLWDCDDRTYSFYIETSINENQWETVVDKRNERLQSWQSFTFDQRPVTYIRIVGTYNSANEIFHIVHFECPNQENQAFDKAISAPVTN